MTAKARRRGLSTMPDKPARARRTRAEMDAIREAVVRFCEENQPLTVPQLFYLLVTAAVIAKTEAEYKQTVVRLCLGLRQAGIIPWEWVVDRTRWFFKPDSYDSLGDALEATIRTYRRSLWTTADVRVQVWCESMSVAGIIDSETARWDVPLYPGKGYSSHDFLRTAARGIAARGVDTVVYLFGDYDPSGRDIIRFVSKMLRDYAREVDPSVAIDFRTVAVTPEQVIEWELPSHPAKTTDSRFETYGITEAVELEAIPPSRLRGLVRDCISQHIDPDAYRRLLAVEEAERETLRHIAGGGGR